MSLIGQKQANGSKSLVKKDYANQKDQAIAFKSLRVLDKPGLGATGIDFTSLTTPTEALGFANPNASALASAQLVLNKNNVTVRSSAKGVLMQNISYLVNSNNFIQFVGFTAEENEIFEVVVESTATTGLQVVDAQPIIAAGTLSAGTTEFSVGDPFELNKYPTKQIGAVAVWLDGVLQFRNSSNATAAPGADGNYQETGTGTLGLTIKFNEDDAINDRQVIVMSVQGYAERPQGSMMAYLEQLQATVDVLVEDAALGFGNLETRYQPAPTQPDLAAFGNRVYSLEQRVNKWQTKKLQADVTVDGTMTDLTFNNLVIGKTYRAFIQAQIATASADNANVQINHNGGVIATIQTGDNASGTAQVNCIISTDAVFVATATTVTFTAGSISGSTIRGNDDFIETWSRLEELNNYETTESSDFT